MFRVIRFFTDMQDNNHPYNVGDTFPRVGMVVNKKRLEELSGSNNARKTPLIEEVIVKVKEDAEKPEGTPKEAPKRRRKKNDD